MKSDNTYFLTGIDTDAGKSYATGYIAAQWRAGGLRVITQKLIQTGCSGMSEDIETHRRLTGTDLLPEDLDGTTCPLRFAYPASPDLAARMEGRTVDLAAADRATEKLAAAYDAVLIEGAGGLMVPISGHYTMADYAADRHLPVILVTNPKLGSVSHTLLSLEACLNRGLTVHTVAYNLWNETSPEITADTRRYLMAWLAEHLPATQWIEVPLL